MRTLFVLNNVCKLSRKGYNPKHLYLSKLQYLTGLQQCRVFLAQPLQQTPLRLQIKWPILSWPSSWNISFTGFKAAREHHHCGDLLPKHPAFVVCGSILIVCWVHRMNCQQGLYSEISSTMPIKMIVFTYFWGNIHFGTIKKDKHINKQKHDWNDQQVSHRWPVCKGESENRFVQQWT